MSKLSDKIGGFATIPNTVVQMIPTIGTEAFTLWAYLRYRTNGETGIAFPSYETIRKDLGKEFHARAVAKAIRTLEANGLMERKKRFGNSTEYTLICPVLSTVKDKSFQRGQTNKTDSNKIKTSLSQSDAPKSEYDETIDTMEKEFFNHCGGTLSGTFFQQFKPIYDKNTDHRPDRLQNALVKMREKRSFFGLIDGYMQWTPPKPATPYQKPREQFTRPSEGAKFSRLPIRTD